MGILNVTPDSFSDGGVKDGSFLYLLKNTKMPAILVKGGFLD
ncbi:hypothetical protein [Clostridium estertheticum]